MMVRYVSLAFLMLTFVYSSTAQTDSPAKLISSQPFKMSGEAEAAGIDGNLSINVSLDTTGAVKDVNILAGPAWPCGVELKKELSDLRKAIKENVRQAKFSPAIKDGRAQASEMLLKFTIGDAYQAELRRREREEAIRRGLPSPLLVKGGVLNGRAIKLPRPDYPASAGAARITGSVGIEILIGEDGNVMRAGAVSGNSVFHDSARDAACKAKFAVTKLSGQPVKVSGVITYHFGR